MERSELFDKAEIVLVVKLLRKQKLVDCYLAPGQEGRQEPYVALYASESVAFVVC